jgi:hypothetical protein
MKLRHIMPIDGATHPGPSQGVGHGFIPAISMQGAYILFNRLAIVIENEQNIIAVAPGIIHRLENHPSGKSPIANHGNAFALNSLNGISARKAEECRKCRTGMADPEGVKGRFVPLRESTRTVRLTIFMKHFAPIR